MLEYCGIESSLKFTRAAASNLIRFVVSLFLAIRGRGCRGRGCKAAAASFRVTVHTKSMSGVLVEE